MSGSDLWHSVLDEARRAAAADAFYGRALSRAVFDQPDLGQAIAWQIATRLGQQSGMRQEFAAASQQSFAGDPGIMAAASRDLQCIVQRDPASPGFLPVLLHFKGYLAVQAWRVSHWLWRQGREDLSLLFDSAASSVMQVSIHPSAQIGTGVFLDHGTGIVIGPFSAVGDDVTIMQNVTIGRKSDGAGNAPSIGRGVLLSSEALILGKVMIGDFAKIGAGAVVDRDVPEGCTAVGVPMRLSARQVARIA